MELVYICSRFRGDEEYDEAFNVLVASAVSRKVITESNGKELPIAPHLYMPQFLNDKIVEERELGCIIGIKALKKCHRMVVCVVDGIISEGMLAEIYTAQDKNMPIDYFYCTKEEMEEIIKKTFE